MGNRQSTTKPSTENSEKILKTYEELINKDFDENISMEAANKFPADLEKAINFVLESQEKQENTQKPTIKLDDDQKNNVIDDYNNNMVYGTNECDNITKCMSLDRIINVLKYHQFHQNDETNDKISQYVDVNKHRIINDYHHILQHHLNEDNIAQFKHNEQFKMIYNMMMNNNLNCNVKKCKIYSRNNREREQDKEINPGIDLLDTIHCYFIHSVDVGYRIIDELKGNNDMMQENACYDKQLINLKSYLQSKRKNLEKIRGGKRMQHSKFLTSVSTNTHKQNHATNPVDLNENNNEKNTNYSFGLRYDYWQHRFATATYDAAHIEPKYKDMKEELINNIIYRIDKTAFDNAYQKAVDLMQTSDKIKSIKSQYDHEYFGYKIKLNTPLSIAHIMAIIFYTDYDTLSFHFSSTFRRESKNKSNKEVEEESDEKSHDFDTLEGRNKEYGNWTKYLVESVNCYGTTMDESNIDLLYHGISFMYFSRFISTFNSPTSTTTKLQIATIFAKENGIILELRKYMKQSTWSNSEHLRYFNCSFISSFANEDERLFIQPPFKALHFLKIVGIRNMLKNENYKFFLNVLSTFQQLLDNDLELKKTVSTQCMNIINEIMDISTTSNKTLIKYPKYIQNSLQEWINSMKEIKMVRDDLKKYAKRLDIWDIKNDNVIRIDKLNKIFKQLSVFDCRRVGTVNVSYLESILSILESINKLNYSQLETIWLFQPEIKYSISEFVKYQSLFKNIGWEIKQDKGHGTTDIVMHRL